MPKREPVQNPLNGRPLLQPTTQPNFYTRGGGAQPPARDNSFLQLAEALSAISPTLQRYQQKKQGESFVEGQASIDLANLTQARSDMQKSFKQMVKEGKLPEKADIFYHRGRNAAIGLNTAQHTLRSRLDEALREGEIKDTESLAMVVGEIDATTKAELGGDPFALRVYEDASQSVMMEFVRKTSEDLNQKFIESTEREHKHAVLSNLEAGIEVALDPKGEYNNDPERAQSIIKETINTLYEANIANPSQFLVKEGLDTLVKTYANNGMASTVLDFLDDISDTEIVPGSRLENVDGFAEAYINASNAARREDNDAQAQAGRDQARGEAKGIEVARSMENLNRESVDIVLEGARTSDMSTYEYIGFQKALESQLSIRDSGGDVDLFKAAIQRYKNGDIEGGDSIRESGAFDVYQDDAMDAARSVAENVSDVFTAPVVQNMRDNFNRQVNGEYEDDTGIASSPPVLDAEANLIYQGLNPEKRGEIYNDLFREWLNLHKDLIRNSPAQDRQTALQEYGIKSGELNDNFPKWINERIKARKPEIKRSQIRQGIQKTVAKLQETISIQNDYRKQLSQPQYGELPNEPEELISLIDRAPNYPVSQIGTASAKENSPFRRFFFGDRDAADQKYYNIVQDVDVRILKDGETRLATKEEKIQAFVEDGIIELERRVKQSGGDPDGNLKGDINLFVERIIDLGKSAAIPDATLVRWGIDPEGFREAKPGQLSNKQALKQKQEALEKYYLLKLQNGLTPDEFLSGNSEDDIPLPEMIDYRSVRLFSNLAELEEAWNGGNIEPGSLFWQIGQKVGKNYDLEPINLYLAQRFLFTQ